MNCQAQAPATLLSAKLQPVAFVRPIVGLDTIKKRDISCLCLETNLDSPGRPTRRLVSVLSELSRLVFSSLFSLLRFPLRLFLLFSVPIILG